MTHTVCIVALSPFFVLPNHKMPFHSSYFKLMEEQRNGSNSLVRCDGGTCRWKIIMCIERITIALRVNEHVLEE